MSSVPFKTLEFPTADGFIVRGDLYLPPAGNSHGIVLLCHGFKGHKGWGFLPYLASRLCASGMAACSIDFSFNGTFFPPGSGARARGDPAVGPSGGSAANTRHPDTKSADSPSIGTRFPRADLFSDNTISREYDDLALVLRHVGGHVRPSEPMGVFGHSRGGVTAILHALENDRIRALCTWSTPIHPDHFTPAQKARWRRDGEYPFHDATDGTRLSLSTAHLDDLERNHDRYDLRRRVENLHVPHLIVHGELDLAVPVESARALHQSERRLPDKRLLILRTGHTFGVTGNPAEALHAPPKPLLDACAATVDWFETHFEKGS